MQMLHDYFKTNNPDMSVYTVCYKGKNSIGGMISSLLNILKTMFYLSVSNICVLDGYNYPVSVLKHRKGLKVYQIWHALIALKKFGHQTIDKPNGYSHKMAKALHMHENYDYVLISGEGSRKHFAEAFNMDEEKVILLGAPILDYLNEAPPNELFSRYPQLSTKKTILYAPTFRKKYSIDYRSIIDEIDFKKYNLVIKQHPLDNQVIQDERVIIDKKFMTEDFIKISDIVITDYSAVSAMAIYLKKRLYYFVPDLNEYSVQQGLNLNLFDLLSKQSFVDFHELYSNGVESNPVDEDQAGRDIYQIINVKDNTRNIYDFIINGVSCK